MARTASTVKAAQPVKTAKTAKAARPAKPAVRRTKARTAEQIGRTAAGPRPVPDLLPGRTSRPPATTAAVLDNGLTVIAVRKPGTPLIEARLRVPFGGRTPAHSARAELLAATLLLGTGSRSRQQVDADLALVGGHLEASVDPQRLLLTGSVLSNGLPMLLDVLSDSLIDPAYRRRDVLGERDRLVEHLAIAAAQPSVVARMHLQRTRFGNHPAALDMPDAQEVANVGAAAVRGLHSRAVVPAGSTLVLVGDLSPARTIRAVEQTLGHWTGAADAVELGTPPRIAGGSIHAFDRSGSVQSQVRLTAGAVSRDDDRYAALQLANLIFGGYFSSRLVENIREDKGYTYGAHSTLEFWPGSAAMTISFDTNTASTAAALLETRYELGRLALVPPTDLEVESARNYALGTLATSLATQAGSASTLAALAGVGLGPDWLREHPRRLAAVTVDQVAAAAAEFLAPAGFTGVVVGDLEQVSGSLRSLGGVELP